MDVCIAVHGVRKLPDLFIEVLKLVGVPRVDKQLDSEQFVTELSFFGGVPF